MSAPRRSRLRPWTSSIHLRLLSGLAVLLVTGLVASSLTSGYFLDDFLEQIYHDTLAGNADQYRGLIGSGPQTVNGDQIGALVGTPLGVVGLDADDHELFSTETPGITIGDVVTAATNVPTGTIASVDADNKDSLMAVRIPSPGLSVTFSDHRTPDQPASLVLYLDTSLDDSKVAALVQRQLTQVAVALVLLLALAVFVLRLGLKPLARMADTADAIAAGSRQERLPTRGDGSETDQLATAVNNAFDAQARAEATVRSFAADASHELRTPLATISGWLDLYHQGGISGAGLETALDHIDVEAGRMRLMVEELALLARLDAGRPLDDDEVDLTALAESVVNDAQIIYPDRDVVLVSTEPALVTGDSPKLQQVLRNLVGNAVEHTPEGSAVRVEIAPHDLTIQVKVIDNGPGISAADLPRVFERFWRAEASRSRSYGGSGLGLAIVEAITHAHHGQVTVESVVGTGTTVTLSLPRSGRGPTTT
jgi:two-component system OmpR family sensor kinase